MGRRATPRQEPSCTASRASCGMALRCRAVHACRDGSMRRLPGHWCLRGLCSPAGACLGGIGGDTLGRQRQPGAQRHVLLLCGVGVCGVAAATNTQSVRMPCNLCCVLVLVMVLILVLVFLIHNTFHVARSRMSQASAARSPQAHSSITCPQSLHLPSGHWEPADMRFPAAAELRLCSTLKRRAMCCGWPCSHSARASARIASVRTGTCGTQQPCSTSTHFHAGQAVLQPR